MRNTRQIAIALSVVIGALATSSIAQGDDVKPARSFQPGDYEGGGRVAPAAKPFQAGDFVGGGGVAVAARSFKPGDYVGGYGSGIALGDTWNARAQDLTAVINDDPRPVSSRGPIHEVDAPLVAQGE